MATDDRKLFIDMTAAPNEREWSVELAVGGGLVVRTYDDAHALFDAVTLKRFGAFIVMDFSATVGPLPASLEFMRPLVEAHRRMRSVGLPTPDAPVLMHSSYIKRALELGQAPMLSAYRPRGTLLLFGVKVVWDENLDVYSVSSGQ